jgi:hypothetical protein
VVAAPVGRRSVNSSLWGAVVRLRIMARRGLRPPKRITPTRGGAGAVAGGCARGDKHKRNLTR